MKKTALSILIVVMALALIACNGGAGSSTSQSPGSATATQKPAATTNPQGTAERVTFKVLAGISAMSPDNSEKPIAQLMSERANVDIVWECVRSDMLTERKNLLFATNDLPDAFMAAGLTDYELMTYGMDGQLIPLNNYINEQNTPNLMEVLKVRPNALPTVTMPDGNIYSLPSIGEMNFTHTDGKNYGIGSIPQFTSINLAWLEALGLKMPTTIDDLHDVLTAFKTRDPNGNNKADEIPLTFIYDHWCAGMGTFFAPFGFTDYSTSHDNPMNNKHRALVDGKVVFHPMQEYYKEAIAYFHEWFKEGLIDVEVFSQDDSQYIAKAKSDPVIVGSFVWWEIPEVVGYDRADDYGYIPILTNNEGFSKVNVNQQGDGVGRSNFSITKNCKNVERLLQWADILFDPIVSMQAYYGPIGDFFEAEPDANGVYVNKTPPAGTSEGEMKSRMELLGARIQLTEHYGTLYYMEPRAQLRLDETRDFWFSFVDSTEFYQTNIVRTMDETKLENDVYPAISSYVAEKIANWLMNGGIEAEWDEYLKTLDKMGIQDVLKAWQDPYDRYIALK